MNYFSILKDKDVFANPLPEPKEYILRKTVKGIVIDKEGNVALLRGLTQSLFPGGGVEEGETLEEAFIRECKEEIGCDIEAISFLGKAKALRAKDAMDYDVDFFVAHVKGEKGSPTTSQQDEVGLPTDWMSQDEVLEKLEGQVKSIPENLYLPHFFRPMHLAAFKKFLEINTSKTAQR